MNGRIITPNKELKLNIGEIGKLKVGEKRKTSSGKEYPFGLDHFKFVSHNKEYERAFTEAYKSKPKTVLISFISDDPSHSCNEYYEIRDNAGKKYGIGDGKDFILYDKTKDGKPAEYNISLERILEKYGTIEKFFEAGAKHCQSPNGWRRKLRLRFILPLMPSIMGEATLETYGKSSSIDQIISAFDMVKKMAGTVVNVPFDLTVKKVTSDKRGEKKSYPVINMIPNIGMGNMEKIRIALDAGNNIYKSGLLTSEKLELLPGEPSETIIEDAEVVED